jgi:hypothetical protein
MVERRLPILVGCALSGLLLFAALAGATLSTGFKGSNWEYYIDAACPAGSALTGLATDSGTYVLGIKVMCTPLPLPGTAAVGDGSDYGGGTQNQDVCPSGESMVGADGHVGSWMDSIQVICRPVDSNGFSTGGTDKLAVRGGAGGGPVSDSCASPDGAIGARVFVDDTDAYIAGIAFECDFLLAADVDPPDTTITTSPHSRTTRRHATFRFESSEDGSSFGCSLDGATAKPCQSPRTYRHLHTGRHRFRVTATDQAENADPTPASFHWKIRKAA